MPPLLGTPIQWKDGRLVVPDHPVIPFIEGDGVGPEILRAAQRVIDASVLRIYGARRRIEWIETLAGEKAVKRTGDPLPPETLKTIERHRVALKGPLATPVGGGIRSLNVALRQVFDLYACIRPVRWFPGVPSPVKRPEDLNVVVFRENTEDLYAGIEWPAGSSDAKRLLSFLQKTLKVKVKIRPDSGLGVKSISRTGTHRLVRAAVRYALEHGLPSVTLVHKGNIMKFTEGAFRDWGYEVARREFGGRTIPEADVFHRYGGAPPPSGTVVIKDRIADSMFQQVLTRPKEYAVIATPNLNGDYLSDACAAQIGGLGMAPGANVGDKVAIFEATHGTAPKHAGQDKVNPCSLILSGCLMLEHIGWKEAADAIVTAIEGAIGTKSVTYDLARQMEGARVVKCSEFAELVVSHLPSPYAPPRSAAAKAAAKAPAPPAAKPEAKSAPAATAAAKGGGSAPAAPRPAPARKPLRRPKPKSKPKPKPKKKR